MAHVLPMATGQVSDPVAMLVQVVTDDRLVHGPTPGSESIPAIPYSLMNVGYRFSNGRSGRSAADTNPQCS